MLDRQVRIEPPYHGCEGVAVVCSNIDDRADRQHYGQHPMSRASVLHGSPPCFCGRKKAEKGWLGNEVVTAIDMLDGDEEDPVVREAR